MKEIFRDIIDFRVLTIETDDGIWFTLKTTQKENSDAHTLTICENEYDDSINSEVCSFPASSKGAPIEDSIKGFSNIPNALANFDFTQSEICSIVENAKIKLAAVERDGDQAYSK